MSGLEARLAASVGPADAAAFLRVIRTFEEELR
jgi:hypothetical protein